MCFISNPGVRVSPSWGRKPVSCSSRTPTFYSSLLQSLCHSRTKLNLPSSLQCISLLLPFVKLMSFIQLEVKAQLLVRGCQRLMDLRAGKKKTTNQALELPST